jgi:hypothetical protein
VKQHHFTLPSAQLEQQRNQNLLCMTMAAEKESRAARYHRLIIDPNWQGSVTFCELMFGSWLAYICLVLIWETLLRRPLEEWQFIMISLSGASAFSGQFQRWPYWGVLLGMYSCSFILFWYFLGVRSNEVPPSSLIWRALAMASSVVYALAYIGLETLARVGVKRFGCTDLWFSATAFSVFATITVWRRFN